MSTNRAAMLLALLTAAGLAGCERPPVETTDVGPRGLGMVTVTNPRIAEERFEAFEAVMPPEIPPLPPEQALQPAPAGTFENVQVLGNISVAELNRTMIAMTAWVSPVAGCNYCHVQNPQGEVNLASDDIYTKVVSRRMIEMTKEINREWSDHVGEEGVTCWTCHRSEPNPEFFWTLDERDPNLGYFLDREDVRVQSDAALSRFATRETSIHATRNTYWFMIHMSNSLGVNCTYCHQSPRLGDWEESPPARIQALRGLRMVRAINQEYLVPLAPILPDTLQGPQGDGPKIDCRTCHAGVTLPSYGLVRATGYPAFQLPPAEHPVADAEAP